MKAYARTDPVSCDPPSFERASGAREGDCVKDGSGSGGDASLRFFTLSILFVEDC